MSASQRSWLPGQRERAGKSREMPGGPVVRTGHFSSCVWVQFLVREPRSYKLHGMAKKKKKCKYSKAHSLPPDQCLGGPCVLRGSLRQGSDTDHPLGVGQGLWQRCCPGEGQGGGRSVTSSMVLLLSWGWGPSVHRGLAPSPPCLPCLPPRPLWVLPRSTKQCTNCRPEIRPFCFLRTGGSLAETPRPSGPLASPQASSR